MTLPRETIWLVTRTGHGIPGPYIPTLGNPAGASDLFRVAGIERTGHEGWNSCYTDVETCIGLARLVEGPVSGRQDIVATEAALQVLMWHDRADVVVPGFKVYHDKAGAFVGYERTDSPRSTLAFDLFRPVQPFDQIYAVEEVLLDASGQITRSSFPQSCLVGRSLVDAKHDYLARTPLQAAALGSIPMHMNVPAYFSNTMIAPYFGKRAFFGQFYDIVAKDWDEALAAVPVVDFSLKLPPLVSVVLDRANARDDIPRVITELREELAPVRHEMLGLAEMTRGAYNQRQIEERCRDVRTSFEAVVAASRFKPPFIALPLLKLYKMFKSPLDSLIKVLNPEFVPPDPRWRANRTVTGRVFSNLLATDSMHSMLTHFFTASELQDMERSTRASAQ
jgi:hypothetical protein